MMYINTKAGYICMLILMGNTRNGNIFKVAIHSRTRKDTLHCLGGKTNLESTEHSSNMYFYIVLLMKNETKQKTFFYSCN